MVAVFLQFKRQKKLKREVMLSKQGITQLLSWTSPSLSPQWREVQGLLMEELDLSGAGRGLGGCEHPSKATILRFYDLKDPSDPIISRF